MKAFLSSLLCIPMAPIAALSIPLSPALTQVQQQAPCADWGSLAEIIMEQRQSGASMSGLMSIVEGMDAADLVRAMIRDAYNRPRYMTREMQVMEIQDFRNAIEALCYQALDGDTPA